MDLKRIVNIMPDDKFLDYYIEMSERFIPDKSSYIFFTDLKEFKYVKSKNKNIIKIPLNEIKDKKVLNEISKAEIIIFHSINELYNTLLNKIPLKTKKIWLFWGFDGYVTQKKKYYIERLTSRLRFEKTLKGNLRYIKNIIYTDNIVTRVGKLHTSLIKQMNYCATWVRGDYDLAKKINSNIQYLYFNYYTEDLMSFPEPNNLNSKISTIFLGNSGSEYNNHAEALHYLNDISFKGKIYCPLSYGGSNEYRRNVEGVGRKFFGSNFIPIKNFMPLSEYQAILNDCDIVWMNHIRQQAAGNLFAAFYMEKIIILNPKNPMVSTFKDWGLDFYDKNILKEKKINITDLKNNKRIKDLLIIDRNRDFFKFLDK